MLSGSMRAVTPPGIAISEIAICLRLRSREVVISGETSRAGAVRAPHTRRAYTPYEPRHAVPWTCACMQYSTRRPRWYAGAVAGTQQRTLATSTTAREALAGVQRSGRAACVGGPPWPSLIYLHAVRLRSSISIVAESGPYEARGRASYMLAPNCEHHTCSRGR